MWYVIGLHASLNTQDENQGRPKTREAVMSIGGIRQTFSTVNHAIFHLFLSVSIFHLLFFLFVFLNEYFLIDSFSCSHYHSSFLFHFSPALKCLLYIGSDLLNVIQSPVLHLSSNCVFKSGELYLVKNHAVRNRKYGFIIKPEIRDYAWEEKYAPI